MIQVYVLELEIDSEDKWYGVDSSPPMYGILSETHTTDKTRVKHQIRDWNRSPDGHPAYKKCG